MRSALWVLHWPIPFAGSVRCFRQWKWLTLIFGMFGHFLYFGWVSAHCFVWPCPSAAVSDAAVSLWRLQLRRDDVTQTARQTPRWCHSLGFTDTTPSPPPQFALPLTSLPFPARRRVSRIPTRKTKVALQVIYYSTEWQVIIALTGNKHQEEIALPRLYFPPPSPPAAPAAERSAQWKSIHGVVVGQWKACDRWPRHGTKKWREKRPVNKS